MSQPAPIPNDRPCCWSLVIDDMHRRDFKGAMKYGTRLQPHNGRDFLQDAYEEALDLVVYLRGLKEEMKELGRELREVLNVTNCCLTYARLEAIIQRYPVLGEP